MSQPSASVVNVTVPHHVLKNLNQLQEIERAILGRLGCGGCYSGFDIRFRLEENFAVREVKGALEINSVAGVVER